MGLSIGLLGPLVIESEESGLGKIPKKARALLAYLAAQGGQAVSRERLADLLWPYQGSEQARHSLRNCLLELRKALRPEAAQYLVCDFAHCRLRDVAVDLDRFERSAREPQRCELQPPRIYIAANSWPISTSIRSPFRNGWRLNATARWP
jgi:DNA-binding SARP family transcriptional activator